MPDWLFVLWAGGTALLSYSLVYALRKPFTAAEFDGLQVAGMDYKIVVSIIQLIGYVCAKMLGINLIDAGHYPTEDPSMLVLGYQLAKAFPEVTVQKSKLHREVIQYQV